MKIIYEANDLSQWETEAEALQRDRQLVTENEIMKILAGHLQSETTTARCVYENRIALLDLLTDGRASFNAKAVAANEVLKVLEKAGGSASDLLLDNQLGSNCVDIGVTELLRKGQAAATSEGWKLIDGVEAEPVVVDPDVDEKEIPEVAVLTTEENDSLPEQNMKVLKGFGVYPKTPATNKTALVLDLLNHSEKALSWTGIKAQVGFDPSAQLSNLLKNNKIFRFDTGIYGVPTQKQTIVRHQPNPESKSSRVFACLPQDGTTIEYAEIKTKAGFDPGPQLANLMTQGRVFRVAPGTYKVHLRTPIVSDKVVSVPITGTLKDAKSEATILALIQEAAQKGTGVPVKALYVACGVTKPEGLKYVLNRLVDAKKITSVYRGYYADPALNLKPPARKTIRVTKSLMETNPLWKKIADSVTTTVTTAGVARHVGVTSAVACYYLGVLAKNKRIRKLAKGRWDVA